MRDKADKGKTGSVTQFELKYCERCGGLWLRPAGGAQVYCVACGREMAKLPAVSREEDACELEASCWDDREDRDDYQSREDAGEVGGAA